VVHTDLRFLLDKLPRRIRPAAIRSGQNVQSLRGRFKRCQGYPGSTGTNSGFPNIGRIMPPRTGQVSQQNEATAIGVSGSSTFGAGVSASSDSGVGLVTSSESGLGLVATSSQSNAIQATTTADVDTVGVTSSSPNHAGVSLWNNSGGYAPTMATGGQGGIGIYAQGAKLAAQFHGDVQCNGDRTCTGTITAGKDIVLSGTDCAEDFDRGGAEAGDATDVAARSYSYFLDKEQRTGSLGNCAGS
jgi:hypothetical protein